MMFKDFLANRMPIKSKAGYVEFGYGQVEPNHLSAQRTGQIYAQLPANKDINVLEQGQFVKYDYAANDNGIGEVNFTGEGEWMLVYNEIKLYRNHPDGSKQWDCEFAMLKDDYQARIYSPYDWEHTEVEYHNGMYLNGKDEKGNTSMTVTHNVELNADGKTVTIAGDVYDVVESKFSYNGKEYTLVDGKVTVPVVYAYDDVTKDVEDIYEMGFTNDPWKKLGIAHEKKMPAGTSMIPRVFKTNVGDIMTTNTIFDKTVAVGDKLAPRAEDGILAKTENAEGMVWQVVKVYTMPDGQKGAKVMRIA
jgi:hypothetical protein